MIELVISGFQTGADIGGIRAAHDVGIPTGGFMPRGWKTEDGPRPEYAAMYGAKEHESPLYPPRTRANIEESDITLIFCTKHGRSPGSKLATDTCNSSGRPFVLIPPEFDLDDGECMANYAWLTVLSIRERGAKVVNCAGNRESSAPGIGAWVERYMREVFRLMRETEATDETQVTGKTQGAAQ